MNSDTPGPHSDGLNIPRTVTLIGRLNRCTALLQ